MSTHVTSSPDKAEWQPERELQLEYLDVGEGRPTVLLGLG